MEKNKIIKLHLGCGKRNIPGFTHVDLSNYAHIDYKRDVGDLKIFRDNSVSLIYASHVLEYFDRIEVANVLKEWKRVLKPRGILRLSVPDFKKLIKVYEISKDLDKILGPLFGKWDTGKNIIYHKTVYDLVSLESVLKKAGFKNIHRYNWRDTIHKNYDDFSQAYYPHMDKDKGILISLNVECVKS